jgi:uncharacterized membrane protein
VLEPLSLGHEGQKKTERKTIMSRNFLFVLIAGLAVVALTAIYFYYRESQSGVDIQINEQGISIDGN